VEIAAVSMDTFADLLSPMVNKPVIDMTGLKGTYRISLQMDDMEWGAALLIGSAGVGINIAGLPGDVPDDLGSTISQTLSRLGLRLESRKIPVQMIVIDHVEKTPTEN